MCMGVHAVILRARGEGTIPQVPPVCLAISTIEIPWAYCDFRTFSSGIGLGGNGESYSDLPSHQLTWETNPSKASTNRTVLTDYSSGERGLNLSGGQKQRVAIASFLAMRPDLLILDEPTTGLDPASRLDLWDVIETLVSDGTTVLLTTQYLDEADQLADDGNTVDGGLGVAHDANPDLGEGGFGITYRARDEALEVVLGL